MAAELPRLCLPRRGATGRERNPHLVGAFRRAYVHKLAVVAQEPQLLSVAIVFLGRCGMAAELPRLCLTVAWSDRQGAQPADVAAPRNAAAELPDCARATVRL